MFTINFDYQCNNCVSKYNCMYVQFQNKCYYLLFTYFWTTLYNCNEHKLRKFINENNNILNQHISDIFDLIKHFF